MFVFKTIIWGMIFTFVALVAGPWIAIQFDTSFPRLLLGSNRFAGLAIMAAGIPFTVYCALILILPGKSRPAPYESGGSFVISGPYRYVRNPFMLGSLITLWGEAIFMSRFAMLAYALIFTWCVHFWVIFFEEPALIERFGDEYRAYKKSVPRWLPQFKKYQG